MKKAVMVLMVGGFVWGIGGGQAWGFDTFPISTAGGEQSYPSISGDIVVWQDSRNSNKPDIYGYDINNHSEFSVCTNGESQMTPDISGNVIVWADYRHAPESRGIIYAYNLSTQTESMLYPGSLSLPYWRQESPAIDGDIVVWMNYDIHGTHDYSDIYGYNISTQSFFQIYENPIPTIEARHPAIDNNYVVWSGWQDGNIIQGKNLLTSTISTLGSGLVLVSDISGDIVVWQEGLSGDYNIIGYNLATQTEFSVSSGSASQENPATSGDYVVWQDNRNGNWDIYGFNLATFTEFPIATGPGDQLRPSISGNTVVWESEGDIYGAYIPEPYSLLLLGLGGWGLSRKKQMS